MLVNACCCKAVVAQGGRRNSHCQFGTCLWFSKVTTKGNDLALTITLIIFRKVTHYCLYQDWSGQKAVTRACRHLKTNHSTHCLCFPLSTPVPDSPVAFPPREIRPKWTSRANWKRVGSHPMEPCDQRGCIELKGDFTTWFALGSLELAGRGVGV